MSEFVLLSTVVGLWEVSTKAEWGSLDFHPAVTQSWVQAIIQAQLTALSQSGAWGNAEKPQWDMAFVLIVASLTIGSKWVFGLTAMWAHPHQACPTLWRRQPRNSCCWWMMARLANHFHMAEWHHVPCAPVQQGHIGAMTDGTPTWMSVAGSISWKYENYCNMGLGGMPRRAKQGAWGSTVHLLGATTLECCCHRWNHLGPTTDRGGPLQHPPWQLTTTIQAPTTTPVLTPISDCHHWTSLWHCHCHQPAVPGGLGVAAADFPTISTPVSQHSMPKRELPSAALGICPQWK